MEIIACTCDLWGLVPAGEPTPTHSHLDPVLGWKNVRLDYEAMPEAGALAPISHGEPVMRWPDGWVEPDIWVDWKAVARALTVGRYTDPGKNWKGERNTFIRTTSGTALDRQNRA